MSRLKANPLMVSAVVRRHLEDLYAVIQAKAEKAGDDNAIGDLRRVEQYLFHHQYKAAGERMREIERGLNEREAAAEAKAAAALAEAHHKTRGVETHRPKTGPASRDGFLWLTRKGRATTEQRLAGERYQAIYGKALSDGLQSCLNDDAPGSGGDGPTDARHRAMRSLEAARAHIAESVGGDRASSVVALVDAVCGRGETLRELALAAGKKKVQVRALVLEVQILIALDMLATHFGLRPKGR